MEIQDIFKPTSKTMKKKVYVASSWRNEHQQTLVHELRKMGYDVYDFKHPNGDEGFKWSNMDEDWQEWTMEEYRENLNTNYARLLTQSTKSKFFRPYGGRAKIYFLCCRAPLVMAIKLRILSMGMRRAARRCGRQGRAPPFLSRRAALLICRFYRRAARRVGL